MNALKRWNQLTDLEAFRSGLDSLWRHSSVRRPVDQEEPAAVAEWSPLVDISEDDKEYLIKAELPEVKKEDVEITADKGTLTIMGERKFEKEEKGKNFTALSAPTVLSHAASRSRMTPAPPRSAPSSKTACSQCIW